MGNDDEAREEKTRLECQYYRTQIMLGRPFLRMRENSQSSLNKDGHFGQDMAHSAVKSATSMAHLIPDEADSTQIYGVRRWWCLLHYVMQTVTILSLELSLHCVHIEETHGNLLPPVKRCAWWLRRTSKHSSACFRAW